jgi:hypothetical protein
LVLRLLHNMFKSLIFVPNVTLGFSLVCPAVCFIVELWLIAVCLSI